MFELIRHCFHNETSRWVAINIIGSYCIRFYLSYFAIAFTIKTSRGVGRNITGCYCIILNLSYFDIVFTKRIHDVWL